MAPLGEVRTIAKYRDDDKYKGKMCQVMCADADLAHGEPIEPYLAELSKYNFVRAVRHGIACSDGDVPGQPSKVIPELLAFAKPTFWAYDDPTFRKGYALLEKYNLTFEAW